MLEDPVAHPETDLAHLLEAPEHQDLLEAPKRRKRPLIFGFLAGLVIAGGITAFLLLRNTAHAPSVSSTTENSSTAHINPSITLYYNDGKTVLYEDKTPLEANDSQPSAFSAAVLNELSKRFGKEYAKKGDYKVTTTLDVSLQSAAEAAVANQQATLTSFGANAASFVAEDVTTGKVVAWVGNFKNASATDDYATKRIQPGSSIKPFVYAALINDTTNVGAGSEVDDSQGTIEGYPCTEKGNPKSSSKANCLWNYDYAYLGSMSLRYALTLSRNVPVVKAANTIGVKKFVSTVKDFGVDDGYNCYEDTTLVKVTECYGAAALGDGAYLQFNQEVHAYATLAAQGARLPQVLITSIKLNGSTKFEWALTTAEQAVKQEAAYIVKDILSDAEASYLPVSQRSYYSVGATKIGLSVGLTNMNDSANVVGFSDKYAAGFWFGNDAGQSLKSPIVESPLIKGWYEWMTAAHKDITVVELAKPTGLQTLNAYVLKSAAGRYGAKVPSRLTDLYPSWYKQ